MPTLAFRMLRVHRTWLGLSATLRQPSTTANLQAVGFIIHATPPSLVRVLFRRRHCHRKYVRWCSYTTGLKG
jgi:hypothetical protein